MLISDWSSDVCSSDRGVVFKLFFTGRFKLLSTAIYVAMGWLVIVAIRPVMAALDGWTLGWLLAGGLFYTLGTVFYHRESIRYSHAIRSEEHTSELQSLMRNSYAVFCLKKKQSTQTNILC